ncbi:MAG: phosphohydrolase, partial [Firmicutes bacterium]|nr:phosphohydrolase [Bacillota bacterium]
ILIDYREVGESLWSRFNAGKEGTLWYYRSLVTAYQKANAPQKIVDELERVVSEIERLSQS